MRMRINTRARICAMQAYMYMYACHMMGNPECHNHTSSTITLLTFFFSVFWGEPEIKTVLVMRIFILVSVAAGILCLVEGKYTPFYRIFHSGSYIICAMHS